MNECFESQINTCILGKLKTAKSADPDLTATAVWARLFKTNDVVS